MATEATKMAIGEATCTPICVKLRLAISNLRSKLNLEIIAIVARSSKGPLAPLPKLETGPF